MKNIDKIKDDFLEFLKVDSIVPPENVSNVVLTKVQKDLSVSPGLVLLKVGVLHSIVTLALLYVCPQFGVTWGTSSVSLMPFFMKFGSEACAALCGITLVGGSFFLAALILRSSESFWLKKQMPLIPIGLTGLTLVLLLMTGASAAHTEFVIWSIFAIIGGWSLFEAGRKMKFYGIKLLTRSPIF